MQHKFKTQTLGNTGLQVGRLGLAASYGAPSHAFEEAFDKGCNYFYTGSGRHRSGMKKAIQNLCRQGHRSKMVISVQTYARFGFLTEVLFKRSLAALKIDYADILMLGWHNSVPFSMLLETAVRLKEKGLCRFIGISGHNRSLFPLIEKKGIFDIFQIRYNAAHTGAEQECFSQFQPKNRPGIVSYTATRWGHLLNPKYMPENQTVLKASDCYRFVLSNPDVDVCLCGPKNIEELRTALTSIDLGPLLPDDLKRVRKIGEHVHKVAKSFFS